MSVGTADLHKAIFAAWAASPLPAAFIALGGEEPTLQEIGATPGQSCPYCVVEHRASPIQTRMTVGLHQQHWIRNASTTFRVFAKELPPDDAKTVALGLAAELMKVFGGHPSVQATATMTLDEGNCLITRYMDDRGIRTNDEEYEWSIDYDFLLDVPARG